jgi:hypothetical protein
MGKRNETALQIYEKDTLKTWPDFRNYYFVYLPGDNSDNSRLNCLDAVVSLLTYSYKWGRSNIFLQVNDTSVSRNDIKAAGLTTAFSRVSLASEENFEENRTGKEKLAENFRETVTAYKPEEKVTEDLAKYYVEATDQEDPGTSEETEKPKKTYFGPPSARNFTLTGIVRDISTGETLPFASIQVAGTTLGTTTNSDGYFTLLKVPSDTCTIVIQYVGYEKTNLYLDPVTPKKNLNINLRIQSRSLSEVTVRAHKDEVVFVKKSEVNIIKLSPAKIGQLPSLGEKDIMRSLQLMPGISASNESSSGLYVRGGTPDQNLVLYDGFTVYHIDHLYGFFSAFNSNALKDIQVYKGGFESRFGGRISSATEITSKEGNQKQINFGFDLSLLSTNVYAELPIGDKFTSFIAFRKSYQGAIYDMIFKKFNRSRTIAAPDVGTGPGRRFSQSTEITSYFYDLNGKFTWKPSDMDIISLSIFNGTDKLDNSFSSNIPSFGQFNANFSMNSVDLTKYGNIGSSLKWSRKWSDKLYGNTLVSYSNYYSSILLMSRLQA